MAHELDPADENPLRVVFLADFLPADQAKLINRIQNLVGPRRLESWKPGSQIIRTPLRKVTDYHWHDSPDTKAHIYEVATRLYRAGHPNLKFLVADHLTWRQLTKQCRTGDHPRLSVVLVVIKSSLQESSGKHSLANETSRFKVAAERHTPSRHAKSLLGGNEEIFTSTDLRLTVCENFEREIQSALPGFSAEELTSHIVSYLDHRMPYHGSSLRGPNGHLT
ncbi:uncharacterized protein N7483_005167 [Penicillium malachiteum]|uniref:uncharacterized protein n=1 Tax=Penicillium malachiteum TaxID=1324776 RepID=UPI0025475407|nr:uncharacterized protein N7483_005167 [Penicillium malachiteum]KAJ5730659.1 hypothetical protein N7483_005167 [Penicillium malachiteum]